MGESHSSLRQAVSDHLASLEAGKGVDPDAQRRLEAVLSRIEPDGELVDLELAAVLADLVFRGCVAADERDDQPSTDAALDVGELAADALEREARRWTGPAEPFVDPITEYTYSIRSRKYDEAAEERLLADIARAREAIGPEATTVDRRVASTLVDLISLTWAQIGGGYRGEELKEVQRSFTRVSNAVLAVFRHVTASP